MYMLKWFKCCISTVVNASYRLFAINHVDEVKESLTTSGYLIFSWLDQRLGWDPAHYGGTWMIRLQQVQIEISLLNVTGARFITLRTIRIFVTSVLRH